MAKKTRTWHVPITEEMDNALEHAIARSWHYTKSEFIREAVREKLESLGVSPTRKYGRSKTRVPVETFETC